MSDQLRNFTHGQIDKDGWAILIESTCNLCGETLKCNLYTTSLKDCLDRHVEACPQRAQTAKAG